MASTELVQSAAISRGLRYDAPTEESDGKWVVRASSRPTRGDSVEYVGHGRTASAANADLLSQLPPGPDSSVPTCPLCHQPLPDGRSLASRRFDAPD